MVKYDLQGTSWGRWRETLEGPPGDQYLPAGFEEINKSKYLTLVTLLIKAKKKLKNVKNYGIKPEI